MDKKLCFLISRGRKLTGQKLLLKKLLLSHVDYTEMLNCIETHNIGVKASAV